MFQCQFIGSPTTEYIILLWIGFCIIGSFVAILVDSIIWKILRIIFKNNLRNK